MAYKQFTARQWMHRIPFNTVDEFSFNNDNLFAPFSGKKVPANLRHSNSSATFNHSTKQNPALENAKRDKLEYLAIIPTEYASPLKPGVRKPL
ncbi:MAG: hypothetical protein AAED33_12195 [Paracoccaceae bacterium]|jgi:hypothetical protein